MGVVSQTVGSLLIGTWINTALWSIEMVLIYTYFSQMGNLKAPLLHAAVLVVGIVDTFCSVVTILAVYDYAIVHWGNTAHLATQHWEFPAYLVATAIVGIIVQGYLTHRYWLLSRNHVISLGLSLCTLLGFGGCISVGVGVVIWNSYSDRNKIKTSVTIWFTAKATTDIAIAIALVFYLTRRRALTIQEETRMLLVRLILYAVETGAVTSIASLIAFGLFVRNPDSNSATAIGQCLGRLHAISLMFNLLFRSKLRDKYVVKSSINLQLGDICKDTDAGSGDQERQTVIVERETVISVDKARELEKLRSEKAREYYASRAASSPDRRDFDKKQLEKEYQDSQTVSTELERNTA